MLIILTILTIWVLINILFVLIVVPARKSRRQSMTKTLSPVAIDQRRTDVEEDEPFSLRHVIVSVAMGAFFVLVPPLLALRDAIMQLFGRSSRNGTKP